MSREKMIQSLEYNYISEKLKGHYLIKAHLLAMCLGVRQFVVHCGHVVFVYIYRWIYHAFMAHGQEATWEWVVPVHIVNFCWYNAVELELSPLIDWQSELRLQTIFLTNHVTFFLTHCNKSASAEDSVSLFGTMLQEQCMVAMCWLQQMVYPSWPQQVVVLC